MSNEVHPPHTASSGAEPADDRLPAKRRTRVLVDGYFVDRSYGFGRYVRELLHALESVAQAVQLYVVVPPRGVEAVKAQAPSAHMIVSDERFFPLWEQFTVPAAARECRAEVVHFPYQTSAIQWPRRQSVMTLHDLIPLGPATAGEPLIDRLAHYYRRWLLRYWSHRAARVISVSEATRAELLNTLRSDSIVIPNAVDSFVERYRDQPAESGSEPYLLHRGGVTQHKNTVRIIEAFNSARSALPELRLRIFGIGADDPFARAHAAAGVEYLGFVEEDRLAALYKGAAGVVTASLQEGFGLTLIEAFAFGAPLITSNRAPMSDIAGTAGLLVDPESVADMAQAMARLVSDPLLASSLRAAGHKRALSYSSAGFGDRLARVYAELAAPVQRTRSSLGKQPASR